MAKDEAEKGIRIMDISSNRLSDKVKKIEASLFEELISLFNSVNLTEGKLSNSQKAEEFLASLDVRINSKLKSSGYYEAVGKFTKDFDLIGKNIQNMHSFYNDINITDSQILPFKRIEVNNTIDKLLGSGLSKDFINPVRQSLYRNVLFGATIEETEKNLRDYVISTGDKDSKLMRYVKQVSRDSISQFDGSVQQAIGMELKLDAKRYVGSLIEDSRAQCIKWVEMRVIPLEELQSEINWALRNGTYNGQRASGMNPETSVNTFDIYRGGYNCRHRSIPTKLSSK